MASPSGGDRQQARKPGRVIPFGKYLLLERIAVGGMAEVYMSKSFGIEGFEKILAIKRILPTMAEDSDFIEMFVDEAKIAGQLNHANIAPIYELGKIGDSHYIAMEYVWGKDLLQIMNRFRRLRKKMPAAMVAWVAAKMSEALDYAHQKRDRRGTPLNIIHRDVSPQNVLVSYEGEVKLIDFGIAKAASRTTKTQAGVLKGKFGYMSPEQVRGLPIDPRSDIFAVGTCMYEMLTADRLFMGESDFSTLEKVRNADVAPITQVVRDCPPELGQLVMRALSKEPADRYSSAGELQEVLMTFLARERPPFGTSKLAAWMKTAFATEMAREKARLDSFAQIGRPSVLGGPRRPPSSAAPAASAPPIRPAPDRGPPRMPRPGPVDIGTDELDAGELEPMEDDGAIEGEATMLTASPFDDESIPLDAVESLDDDELNAQPTQIFFSADDEADVSKSPLGSGGGPSMNAPAPFYPAAPSPAFASPSFTPPPSATPNIQVDPGMVHSHPPAGAQLSANQRSLNTIEVRADQVPQAEKSGGGKMAVAFILAALVMLAVGAGAVWVLMGGSRDPVGTIEIRTVPPVAAEVRIDGLGRGTAPLRIDRMPIGEHVIELEAEGFESTQRRVTVNDGATAMLEVALLRGQATPSEPGVLAQNTVEQAAEPLVGQTESPVGETEPSTEAPSANTDAPVRAAEGTEREQAAPIREAAPPSMSSSSLSSSSSSSLASSSSSRRNTSTSTTTGSTSIMRREPTTDTTASADTTTMEVARATRPQRIDTPAEAGGDAAFGTLVINSLPWAHVFIDGRDTGRNTPVPSLRVRSGSREIGLRTPDGQMHNFTEVVPPGGTVRVMKRL